jgi:hypothetical protein
MYFPYLYGRQSELLAVSSMLKDHRSLDSFLPVIEPVVGKTNGIVKLLEAYGKKGKQLGVVVNPNKYELASSANSKPWADTVWPVVLANKSILPVLRYEQGVSFAHIKDFLKKCAKRDVALAYTSAGLLDVEFKELAKLEQVRFHIILDEDKAHHRYGLLPTAKLVHIDDRFKKLTRNADYGGPEFFSRQHRTFLKQGIAGFGDYCSLGKGLAVGGGKVAAVAIHAAYMNEDKDAWMEHFVSTDKDVLVGSPGEKFLQAARKLDAAAKKRPLQFGSNFALDKFAEHVANRHYPGLGKNKELQIAHHICFKLDAVAGKL